MSEAKEATDSLWILVNAVIVFLMQSGFTLLESGSVRKQNQMHILTKNLLTTCMGPLFFFLTGFAIAFGTDSDAYLPTRLFPGDYDDDPRQIRNWCIQYVFAANAATIVSGSIAERTRLYTYLIFAALMTGFIYPVGVSWTWGGGWLHERGYTDYAGSGIIHMVGGVAGLVGAIFVGPRQGRFKPLADAYQFEHEQENETTEEPKPSENELNEDGHALLR